MIFFASPRARRTSNKKSGARRPPRSQKNTGIIVGAMSFNETVYHLHTLPNVLESVGRSPGACPSMAICDRGYRGLNLVSDSQILVPKSPKKGHVYQRLKVRLRFRRWAAIEPVDRPFQTRPPHGPELALERGRLCHQLVYGRRSVQLQEMDSKDRRVFCALGVSAPRRRIKPTAGGKCGVEAVAGFFRPDYVIFFLDLVT